MERHLKASSGHQKTLVPLLNERMNDTYKINLSRGQIQLISVF